jgi:hypothetical protein
MLAAVPLRSWGESGTRYPLALIPCLGTRYDRNGFPTYPRPSEDE